MYPNWIVEPPVRIWGLFAFSGGRESERNGPASFGSRLLFNPLWDADRV